MDSVNKNSLELKWRKRMAVRDFFFWFAWFSAIAVFILCWRLMTENTMWIFVLDAPEQASDLFSRMLPPKWNHISKLLKPLFDTINMATLGTLLGIIIAVPCAFFAARNTTPSVRFFRPAALLIIVSSRSINSLIWALLMVSVIGPGILAGIIAIALRSIGFVSKLLYEAIEEIDESQVEAVSASGGSPLQVLDFGIIPQILPAFFGISVFRWDINIRESAILGLVGAGGLGLSLSSSLAVLAWPEVTMIILVILGTVVISEWVSGKVRNALI